MAPFKSNFPQILKNKPQRYTIGVNIKLLCVAILNMLLLILLDIRIGHFQDGD